MSFQECGLHPALTKVCQEVLQWEKPSEIQSQVLPPALTGRDIIGLAETGSGKTGAFLLPVLNALLTSRAGKPVEKKKKKKSDDEEEGNDDDDSDKNGDSNDKKQPVLYHPKHAIFALVLTPTRELAFQIQEVLTSFNHEIGTSSIAVTGGVDMTQQAIQLAKRPHCVIATPGRLVDHLEHTKGFNLNHLKYLVLDEADRMLSMDFEEELNKILDVIPDRSTGNRRTFLFSATMTSKVQKLQRASLHDPIKVEISASKFQVPKNLLQSYMFIPAKYKDCYFTYIINEMAGQSILVFVQTCNNAQRLAILLRNLGFAAVCLHGQMSQPKRMGALHKFKSGGREILICTDVASRGLDIPSVDCVINYDLPGHGKDYIHRVGRTARAGRSGKAIAMVTQYDVEVYQRIESLLGMKLPSYDLDEETVLVLLERVSDAQRLATRELKEMLAAANDRKGNKKNKNKRGVADAGLDGGDGELQQILKNETKKSYAGKSSNGKKKKGGKR